MKSVCCNAARALQQFVETSGSEDREVRFVVGNENLPVMLKNRDFRRRPG